MGIFVKGEEFFKLFINIEFLIKKLYSIYCYFNKINKERNYD